MSTKVVIADVAKRAQVSTATVSRILSGQRTKKDKTFEKVRTVAKELNYSANYAARTLRKNQSDTIGLIVPQISNPFFAALAEEVEMAANADHKQLLICGSNQNIVTERDRLRTLLSRHVDGIIIVPSDQNASSSAINFAAKQVPVIQIDQKSQSKVSDWIGIDDKNAMFDILNHLKSRNASTIAFFGSGTTNSSGNDRLNAFLESCNELSLSTRPDIVLLGDYSIDWGKVATKKLLALEVIKKRQNIHAKTAVDAIVCSNDLIAFGVLKALSESGVRVPEDLLVTGFDDTFFASCCTPSLTTSAQPVRQIASEAIHLIRIRGKAASQKRTQVLLTSTLKIRSSTGGSNKSSS